MSQQTPSSSTESSTSDVATPLQGSSNGHGVATLSGQNGSRQYKLSQSDLVTDDRTNDDIFETDISEEVYEQNYQYGTDDRVPDTWYRNARAMASIEDDVERWTRRFYQLLSGKGLDTGPFPFTPGGRIFANAGTGLGKATLINCLAGETLVLTDQGRIPIEELAGATATLLTRNGKWVEAPVRSYGQQPLRKVTLSRNGQERVIYATPNHRWYVTTKATTGYEVVETDELRSHHRLERVHSRRHTSVSPSPVGIARGFTFGDGSLVSVSPGTSANVNLVGEKDASLGDYFAPFSHNESRPAGRLYSDGVTRYRGLPDAWKTTPVELDENSATLYGWVAGYFAADGCVSEDGEVIMDSCTGEHVEHFVDVIEVLGIDHYGIKSQQRTSNLTGDDSTRYYVRLNPRSLREEFFVLDKHRIRFRENGDRSLTYHWTVESVEETDRHETVYCAEVPEEKAFALDNGILTGNCFVSGFQGYDQDSMDEIQAELTRQAKILASEGGYGFCCHVMRPRGARISGVGSMTPGAVQMLDVWNKQAATIVAGSGMTSDRDDVKDKIRKGAQMVTMGIWHPDVIEFIEAKQEPGRLHKFNMSVLVTDEFMEAVKNDEKWALRFPDYENEKEFYKEHWDGNLKAYQEKGGTVKVWRDPATGEKAIYDAREIWDKIMRSTYERNEPGVIFVDTINKENNLNYVEHINATNPCVTGDTWVMTSDGPRQVEQLLDEPFEAVVDSDVYPATNFFQTGTKDVLHLQTKEGYELRLTEDHEVRVAPDVSRYSIEKEWREAQNLEPGDKVILHNHRDAASWNGDGDAQEGYLAGLFVGDGSVGSHGPVLSVWEDDHSASIRGEVMECVEPMNKRSDFGGWYFLDERNEHRLRLAAIDEVLERFGLTDKNIGSKVEEASAAFYRGFLKGFFDADGSVQGTQTKGVSVRLAQSDLGRLKAVQRMLHRLGIASTIYQNRRDAGHRELPNGKGGTDLYHTQAQHELVISNDNLRWFADLIGFTHDGKQDRLHTALESYDRAMNRERFVATVQSVEQDGTEPVYDTTVEEVHSFDANGIYVHNCGEQVLPVGGVCLLGNLNVTQLVDRERGEIDYDLLDDLVPLAVRFLDNVNDLSYVPLEEQKRNLQEKRRIGLGHYGDGSALMMMKKRYGSEEGARVMREFQEHLANRAYQASARLAEEKGAFPLFDKDEYLSSPFVQRLSDETKEMVGDLGLRNSHLLSIQPTGNTSTLGNAPSSGIEPVFMHSYIRTSEQPALPEGINRPPMSPDAYEVDQEIDADGTAWVAEEHGDETVLRCQEEGYTHWQIHPTRGICKDQEVKDYAVRHMERDGTWDPDADWAVTTRDLDVDDHLTQMKALAPFVDSSMSKTVNVPQDYPFEDFKELYRKAHETGVIKGVTTYRAGTMSAVLSGDEDEDQTVPRTDAPDRPKTLPCAIHRVRYRGDHWTILVGFLKDDPYEVFAFKSEGEAPLFGDDQERIDEGYIRKNKSRHYSLLDPDEKVMIDDITSHMPSDEVREETRLVSTALRHGSKIDFLVEQLEKAEGSIASFGRSMAKALSAHASDHEVTCDRCGSSNVRHVEGCMKCADCGHSRCS